MKSVLAFLMGFSLAFVTAGDALAAQIIALMFTMGFGLAWVRPDLN